MINDSKQDDFILKIFNKHNEEIYEQNISNEFLKIISTYFKLITDIEDNKLKDVKNGIETNSQISQ